MKKMPPEWHPHLGCLVAWPYRKDLWGNLLSAVQKKWLEMCSVMGAHEKLWILLPKKNFEAYQAAILEHLKGVACVFLPIDTGDIWLRDTGPIFTIEDDSCVGNIFRFNAWGGKYDLVADEDVARLSMLHLSSHCVMRSLSHHKILEGGSIETNGLVGVTTKQCLLNINREATSLEDTTQFLMDSFGWEQVHWLSEGLDYDHTDGHVDNICRFFNENSILIMHPVAQDPQRERLLSIEQQILSWRNTQGLPYHLVKIPSPGKVLDDDHNILPASYLNFYIANGVVCVPMYDRPQDQEVLAILKDCFKDRNVVGILARDILLGGGAFHCITQQIPLLQNITH